MSPCEPEDPAEDYKRPAERIEFIKALEKEAENSEMNIDSLVRTYKKTYPGDAVWMLMQDINRQALIWSNIIETLKSGSQTDIESMKGRYQKDLQILPERSLSNPNWLFDVDRAFDKVRNYSKGLLKLARSYSLELLAELNVEIGTAAKIEVELGFPPTMTIGFEKSFTGSATLGVTASRA